MDKSLFVHLQQYLLLRIGMNAKTENELVLYLLLVSMRFKGFVKQLGDTS